MSKLIHLPDLSHRAYEHPTGRAALAMVRRSPRAVTRVVDLVSAGRMRSIHLAGALRIGEHQLAHVWEVFLTCCDILDVSPPELYVSRDPAGHTGALGTEEPFIVLSAATLKLFEGEPAQLRFLLGRELGHVLSGHAVYNSALGLLMRTRSSAAAVPVLGLAVHGTIAILKEFNDDSNYSADRAGLLCAQDLAAARGWFATMAGGDWDNVNEEAFLAQEQDYNDTKSPLDTVVKLISSSTVDSPRYVLRYQELHRWVEEGAYQRILDGDYPRRSEDSQATFKQEAGVTWGHVRERAGAKKSAAVGWWKSRRGGEG